MTRGLNAATACLLAVLGGLVQGPSRAAEIVVLTNMGVVSAVRDLAPAFERASGHKVIISFELGNAMMQKINSNAPADVVTQTPDVIDDLIKQGKVVGERVDFARAGIGVAVKAGAPKPDIGSADAFKRSMLAAKSIAYSRAGASGVYVAKLMQRLGIADELKDKIKLVDGVPVAELVAKGEIEIGMQQINVILPVGGIDYVGPLHRSYRVTSCSPPGFWRFRRHQKRRGPWQSSWPRPRPPRSFARAAWSRPHVDGDAPTQQMFGARNVQRQPRAALTGVARGQSAGPAGAIGLGFTVFR